MARKQKLELTWIGKDDRPKLEPRILIEDKDLSFHADHRVSKDDIFDNILIQGDNLLALKALEADYTGQIKCIYIDPPYNTGNAFEYYDDGIEHSLWLSLMRDRIKLLRKLLRDDGFFCCHIDDSEGHYLKVLLDEVFGRENYLSTIYVQVRYADKTLKQDMSFHKQIEQIHIYRKSYDAKPNLNTKANTYEKFCYYIEEKAHGQEIKLGGKKTIVFKKSEYKISKGDGTTKGLKEIWATGSILDGNSSGRFFRDNLDGRVAKDGLGVLYKVYGIGDDQYDYRYFTGPKREGATKGKYFQGVPISKIDNDSVSTKPIENYYDLAGSFGNCRLEGGVDFRSGKKPEKLLKIIIEHFSNPGDLVLDSFAGSGSTAATAHKLKRRWVTVEIGEHCQTHVFKRLRNVIQGQDETGITKEVDWKGGGGFRFYNLGASLIKKDSWDNAIINPEFNPEMLAEALCKLEGFSYEPSDEFFWMHGKSTESDFIYVTTQFMSKDMLSRISDEVGPERSLLICCGAFRCNPGEFPNLTIKKIPKNVLKKCEWDHDDYSLEIKNLPAKPESDDSLEDEKPKKKSRKFGKANKKEDTLPLFS